MESIEAYQEMIADRPYDFIYERNVFRLKVDPEINDTIEQFQLEREFRWRDFD